MGTTLTTLNLFGAERSAIETMLAPSDLLRDQNPPWLTVVPSHDTEGDNLGRLEKAAKKLTKQNEAAALLFYYFDDDMFTCSLYQNGKKSASCESFQSWAKLGKKLSERLGDAALPKAFRYSVHCSSLEEQIKLFEETIGTALYELQEDEPRTVARGDSTLRQIKAREAMLKKRPNKFKLTELDPEDWPQELQYRQKLYDTLRPHWQQFSLAFFLYQTDMSRYMVPGGDGLIAYPYTSDWNAHKSKLLLMNGKNGECSELGPFDGDGDSAVWQTKSGDIVVMLRCYAPTLAEAKEGRHRSPFGLVRLSPDGAERWRFRPELPLYQEHTIQYIHTSDQGIITLFAGSINAATKADARIYMVDAETGELLHTRSYPYQDNVHHMIHVGAMNAFLLCKRSSKELVLLDEALNEMRVFEGFTGSYYFKENQLCGSILWEGDYRNQRFVTLFDLRNGTVRKTYLEVPAYAIAILPDGRILGMNEKQSVLTVFDPAGGVVARCTVPGTLSPEVLKGDGVYLAEVRGPNTHGYVYDELFDETSIHIWRLDPDSSDK